MSPPQIQAKSISHAPPSAPGRQAFTLIELLVVVAIIGVLAGLLFPVFKKVAEAGNAARCVANLRQLSAATISYATEYNGLAPLAGSNANQGKYQPNYFQVSGDVPKADEAVASYLIAGPADLGSQIADFKGQESKISIFFCPSGAKTLGNKDRDKEMGGGMSSRYGFVSPQNFAGNSHPSGGSPALVTRTFNPDGGGQPTPYILIHALPHPSTTFMWMDYPLGAVTTKQALDQLERSAARHDGKVNTANFDGSVASWDLAELLATLEPSHEDHDVRWLGL